MSFHDWDSDGLYRTVTMEGGNKVDIVLDEVDLEGMDKGSDSEITILNASEKEFCCLES